MLACDASHPFRGTKESFLSRFRPGSFHTHQSDLATYGTMFTEPEAKDMTVKGSSSPSHVSHTPSPSQPQTDSTPTPTITHVTAPAQIDHQHQRRSISPEDIDKKSIVTSASPSRHSPVNTTTSSSPTPPRNVPVDSHQMAQLLHQQRQHQHHQQEDDDEDLARNSHHHPSYEHRQQLHEQQQQHLLHQEHQQRLQQARQYSKDLELDLSMDKGGNYSDSDSSGPNGAMDSDMSYNSKRFRDLVPDTLKDEMYWEKRRRNNEAARRSREKRRMQDMALEGRISCLESDNGRLRRELSVLKKRFNVPDGQQPKEPMEEDIKEIPPPKTARMSSPTPSSQAPSHHTSNTMAVNNSHNNSTNNPNIHPVHNSSSASRSHVENTPYTSPPPLLTVAGAIQMGMAVYPSPGPALPYFFTEASRMNQEVRGGGIPHGIPSLPTGHPHLGPAPVRRNSTYPPIDEIKRENPTNEEVRIRERSNSSVIDRRSSYQMDMSDMPAVRRGSVGSYGQYGRPLSPSMPAPNHPSYPGPLASRGSNPGHFLPRPYETNPYSQYNWSQRSPASSHSSDDYDEPLQLTVRRDSNLSTQSTHSTHSTAGMDDTNSRESDQGGNMMGDKHNMTPGSPPASSFPLKLRHKLPPHDVYSKDIFPNMSPSGPVPPGAAGQPSFPPHPFINGLAHLSDIAMGQNNPLSLIKKESFRQRRDSTNRAMARRNPLDQKYMDPKYLERRRRNNEAARKCRENRKTLTRIREVKSDYLENENNKLREELNGLQEEMKQLRELLEKKRMEKGLPIDDLDTKPLGTCNDV